MPTYGRSVLTGTANDCHQGVPRRYVGRETTWQRPRTGNQNLASGTNGRTWEFSFCWPNRDAASAGRHSAASGTKTNTPPWSGSRPAAAPPVRQCCQPPSAAGIQAAAPPSSRPSDSGSQGDLRHARIPASLRARVLVQSRSYGTWAKITPLNAFEATLCDSPILVSSLTRFDIPN